MFDSNLRILSSSPMGTGFRPGRGDLVKKRLPRKAVHPDWSLERYWRGMRNKIFSGRVLRKERQRLKKGSGRIQRICSDLVNKIAEKVRHTFSACTEDYVRNRPLRTSPVSSKRIQAIIFWVHARFLWDQADCSRRIGHLFKADRGFRGVAADWRGTYGGLRKTFLRQISTRTTP